MAETTRRTFLKWSFLTPIAAIGGLSFKNATARVAKKIDDDYVIVNGWVLKSSDLES